MFVGLSHAQIVQTLQIGFEKTTIKCDKEEHISGTIYYQQPDVMCMIIQDPVNQWIFSGKDTMVLYYPDDTLAFKFRTTYPIMFPFFQAFLGIVQEDYGLSSIGYTLTSHEVKDNLLTVIWIPPKDAPKDVGQFRITYANDRLINAIYETSDGTILSRTDYTNHYTYGAYHFPLKIAKMQYTDQDSIQETIIYKNPQFNCALPETLMNFRIPSSVTIENIQW